MNSVEPNKKSPRYEHGSSDEFYQYYEQESVSQNTLDRLTGIRDRVLRILSGRGEHPEQLEVADIGCGAGTLSTLWAERGHNVHGLDVNEPLINLARSRAAEQGYNIIYHVGTATDLPWADSSMDVCLVPELLEHVAEWRQCLDEFSRILKPGGLLYLSTNNKLCPVQQEFDLPLYSWYPGFIKRYCERLAVTTRPQIAGHATYPAVNWFTFYSLRKEMASRGFDSLDRFDVIETQDKGKAGKIIIGLIKKNKLARLLGHIGTPYTQITAIKKTA